MGSRRARAWRAARRGTRDREGRSADEREAARAGARLEERNDRPGVDGLAGHPSCAATRAHSQSEHARRQRLLGARVLIARERLVDERRQCTDIQIDEPSGPSSTRPSRVYSSTRGGRSPGRSASVLPSPPSRGRAPRGRCRRGGRRPAARRARRCCKTSSTRRGSSPPTRPGSAGMRAS